MRSASFRAVNHDIPLPDARLAVRRSARGARGGRPRASRCALVIGATSGASAWRGACRPRKSKMDVRLCGSTAAGAVRVGIARARCREERKRKRFRSFMAERSEG
jgi:hypothetical protein